MLWCLECLVPVPWSRTGRGLYSDCWQPLTSQPEQQGKLGPGSGMVVEVGVSIPQSSCPTVQACKLPDPVLEAVFAFLELPDLQNCSLVCKNW